MRIAIVAPVWFPVPPRRLRRHRARRRRCSPTASSTPATTSRCSRRGGSQHQGDARVTDLTEPPDRSTARQPVVRRVPRARRRTCDVDDFDVVHDHAGIVGPVVRRAAAAATRRSCTRCTDRGPSETRLLYGARRRARPPRRDQRRASAPTNPDVRYAGTVHNGIDLDAYPYRAEKDDYLVYIGRAEPRQGPGRGDHDRTRRRQRRCKMILKRGEPPEHRVLRARDRNRCSVDDIELFENVDARGEGRPARPRAARWCSRSAGRSRSGS